MGSKDLENPLALATSTEGTRRRRRPSVGEPLVAGVHPAEAPWPDRVQGAAAVTRTRAASWRRLGPPTRDDPALRRFPWTGGRPGQAVGTFGAMCPETTWWQPSRTTAKPNRSARLTSMMNPQASAIPGARELEPPARLRGSHRLPWQSRRMPCPHDRDQGPMRRRDLPALARGETAANRRARSG
jgi:hypothetical protein